MLTYPFNFCPFERNTIKKPRCFCLEPFDVRRHLQLLKMLLKLPRRYSAVLVSSSELDNALFPTFFLMFQRWD